MSGVRVKPTTRLQYYKNRFRQSFGVSELAHTRRGMRRPNRIFGKNCDRSIPLRRPRIGLPHAYVGLVTISG